MAVSPDCIAAVREASGGTFSDSEATDLIRRMEQRRKAEEAAGNLDHLDDRLRAAAAADADRARIAAALARKHAALAALAFDRATRQVEQLRAAGLDRRKALLAFLEGTTRNVEGGRESLAATALAFRARYLEQLNLALVRDPETAALVRSGDQGFARAVVREMRELRDGGRPGVTGNRQAQELARLYGEIAERARGDLNRFGATIGRLDGWSPQAHAADRVVKVGADEWLDFILPRLDRERSFPGMPDDLVRLTLRDVHQAIITGVERNPSTAETTGRIGPANLANSLSAARVLHFKDATAWLQYAERFGAGNIHEAMLAHLTSASKYAAQLQRLGPNPEQTMTRLRAQLAREAASDRSLPAPERQRLARALAPGNQQGSVASAWAEVSGLTAVPVSIRAAQIGTAARAWQTLAKLGGAVISSISDLPVRAAAMTYQGRPIAAAWGDALGGLRRGSAEARETAAILNAGLDGIHNSIVAAGLAEDMPLGRLQRITSLMFRWQGMTWWTDRMKAGAAQALARWMALNAGSRFDALPPRYRAVLRQQGITPQEWDAIRRLARQAEDGAAYITPDTVAALPRAVLAGLAREQLEAQQRGLADRIARREQSNATEAGWITRRTEALNAGLQRQLARLQRQNQAAAGATDRRTQRLRERMEELQLRLSELAEFSQAVAEGRTWTPATEEAAPAGDPARSANVSLSGDASTEGGRVFSPKAERYLDDADPATLAARAEGELRARLDALRRAIGGMNRAMGQAEQGRLAELTSWWNARQQELADFTRRVGERADARRQATERELGDYDARVQRVLDEARLALEIKLRRFFADEMGFAFLETDAASRRLTLWGTRPGTVTGELLRALAQFKGFPVAFTQRVLGRALQGYAPEERALQARNMGVLLAGLMVTGYLAMTVKDFLRGYGPRDPTKPATLLAALMQSGGAGIYGDFLFAQGSRFGNSTLETLAGPLLGTAAGTVNLAQKLRDGDAKAGEALNLTLQNTPFLGLWYLRPALDFLVLNALRESLSPGFMQRQRRNRLKDYGQEPHQLIPASLF